MIFGTENKERNICYSYTCERIYPTRVGWGFKEDDVKTKNKKKYMTVAVNNGELCAKMFYVMEISDINERRIANRK